MKCVILTGGEPPERRLLEDCMAGSELTISVDGASDVFYKHGIIPDVLIGDFDTADKSCVKALEERGAKVIVLKEEKNETDSEAAVDYALSCGADDITILGALGGRTDHLLSNVMMLVRADMAGAKCRILTEECELLVSDKDFRLFGEQGQTVSILPLTGEICVDATDLKYPLDNLLLKWGSSRGISNIMLGECAHISVSGGYALIVKNNLNP
jgi:thiamine pyrophosphokinase